MTEDQKKGEHKQSFLYESVRLSQDCVSLSPLWPWANHFFTLDFQNSSPSHQCISPSLSSMDQAYDQ